jgi:hypothetical protein
MLPTQPRTCGRPWPSTAWSPGSPEALGARIRDDVEKWRKVITSADMRES